MRQRLTYVFNDDRVVHGDVNHDFTPVIIGSQLSATYRRTLTAHKQTSHGDVNDNFTPLIVGSQLSAAHSQAQPFIHKLNPQSTNKNLHTSTCNQWLKDQTSSTVFRISFMI